MDQNQLKDLLYRADAVRPGHFLRASGRHSNLYIQCAHLFENARSAQEVCALIAQHYAKSGVQLVLSAAIGGMLAGYEVSRQLGVRNMYAERRDQVLTLRRGFAFAPGTRVLIVEDMVSTGHSVRELIEIVRALGGEVVGISCIIDSSGGKVAFEYPYYPLYCEKVENYQEADCPLCKQNKPFDNV